MRRVACITLIDNQGRYLLQHREEDRDVLPGHWSFFGGGIEEGETPEQALYRETKEELGIDLVDPIFVLDSQHESVTWGDVHKYVWIADAAKQGPIVLGEGQGYGYFTLEEIKALKIVHHDIETFEAIDVFIKRTSA